MLVGIQHSPARQAVTFPRYHRCTHEAGHVGEPVTLLVSLSISMSVQVPQRSVPRSTED